MHRPAWFSHRFCARDSLHELRPSKFHPGQWALRLELGSWKFSLVHVHNLMPQCAPTASQLLAFLQRHAANIFARAIAWNLVKSIAMGLWNVFFSKHYEVCCSWLGWCSRLWSNNGHKFWGQEQESTKAHNVKARKRHESRGSPVRKTKENQNERTIVNPKSCKKQ